MTPLARPSAVVLAVVVGALTCPTALSQVPVTPFDGSAAPGGGMEPVPLAFVENRGQWDTPALFVARKGPITVRVEDHALIVDHASPTEDGSKGLSTRFVFEDARDDVEVVGTGLQPGVRNYFLGDEAAVTGALGFGSVLYRGLYEGVDVRVRDHDGKLEYDLLLAPGANLEEVRVRCVGIDGLEVEDDGTLSMHTALGTIHQSLPATWAELDSGEHQPLACTFVKLDETRYGLRVPERDPRLPVVIDPGLEWATYLGGTDVDAILAVEAVDATGEIVVAGASASTDFPTTAGVYEPTGGGSFDGFVARMDPGASGAAQLVWSTYFGGSNIDWITDIRLDAQGNVFGVGTTYSDDLPTTANAYDPIDNPGVDGFVLELSSDGSTLLYSTYFGGSNFDDGLDIELTPPSTVTIGGATSSLDLPTVNPFQPTFGGGTLDYYVARLDLAQAGAAGLVYGTYLGGSGDDGFPFDVTNSITSTMMDVTVHATTGEIVVTGRTQSSDYPTTGDAYQASMAGSPDAIVTLLDPTLPPGPQQLTYSTFLGGAAVENPHLVHVDSAGVITIAGATFSADYPTTPGAFSTAFNDPEDTFVTRLDPGRIPAAQLLYSTYLGGSGPAGDFVKGMDVTPGGDVIVVGATLSADYPVTCGAFDTVIDGPLDGIVAWLACDGNGTDDLLYCSFLGGSGTEFLLASDLLSTSGAPRVIAAGVTDSLDVPTTTGAFQGTYAGGGFDSLVVQLELNPHTYCTGADNSVGDGARICGLGSVVIGDNNLLLSASDLPPNQFGYFLMSEVETKFAVGQGFICLGSPVVRFNQNVLNSGATGMVSFPVDMNNLPQGTVFLPGETWRFQLWYRDNNPGPTSNFSNGLAVTFH